MSEDIGEMFAGETSARDLARTPGKGTAEVREWEITDNSTRYDYLLAAPSDETLTRYWSAWAGISLFGGLFTGSILIAFLLSKNVRSRAFNLYLIYLMIPDSIYSLLCGIVCLIHALNRSQVASMCNFQMMFIVWGVGSNMWINAFVTHQLYSMLRGSSIRKKYVLPTNKFVSMQAVGTYIAMLFIGSWGLIESMKWPHYVASTSGLACLPMEQDWKSSIFFWLVFFPLFGGAPIAYIHYVTFAIWKKKLLPPSGKRRMLVIYFGRIVVSFIVCWVPYMVLLFVFTTWMPTWVHFLGGTLSHLQGAVAASISLMKPDLLAAVRRVYCCKKDAPEPRASTTRWMFNFNAMSTIRKSIPRRTSTRSLRAGGFMNSVRRLSTRRLSTRSTRGEQGRDNMEAEGEAPTSSNANE